MTLDYRVWRRVAQLPSRVRALTRDQGTLQGREEEEEDSHGDGVPEDLQKARSPPPHANTKPLPTLLQFSLQLGSLPEEALQLRRAAQPTLHVLEEGHLGRVDSVTYISVTLVYDSKPMTS